MRSLARFRNFSKPLRPLSCLPRCLIASTSPSPYLSEFRERYAQSVSNPQEFWGAAGKELLQWSKPFNQVASVDINKGDFKWFSDGTINASVNCIDRHLPALAQKPAIFWEKDKPGESEVITYQQLHDNVCRMANVLKSRGVTKGDTVALYMPTGPQAVYTMLACTRIGASHCVVFAGFSVEALHERLRDSRSKVLVCANQSVRAGKFIDLKAVVDKATAGDNTPDLKHVIVYERTTNPYNKTPRDLVFDEELAKHEPVCEPVPMDSEDPMFVLYTSGSTGKPKGLIHSTGGYLLSVALSFQTVFDIRQGDVFGAFVDVGWVTGHSYLVYGPLLSGVSTVLFESIPTYPTPSRYWEVVERLKLTQFYVSPTAIRVLIKEGASHVAKHDRSSLRLMGTVGEPINPEAWKWFNEVVGDSKLPIVDTWWQTETGSAMMTPLPTTKPLKPGSCMQPFYGCEPVLLDDQGREVEGNDVQGNLCLRKAPPSMARTILGDHDRYLKTYFSVFPGYYATGDAARRDADGHYWILGRTDDVLNVSGHRLGTAEVESALVTCPLVSEAAVVGFPHDIKGEGIFAFVTLKNDVERSEAVRKQIKARVKEEIGGLAVPDYVLFAEHLPKTRSGKIMRRVLRKIASGETRLDQFGDLSTLADPQCVEDLVASRKALH